MGSLTVRERAEVLYAAPAPMLSRVVKTLGGRRVVGRTIHTWTDLNQRLRDGLPYASLECVATKLDIPQSAMTAVLTMSPSTLARRKRQGQLAPDESDRLCRVARVYAHACAVLEEDEKAQGWVREPNAGLGGQMPLDLLATDIGTRQVDEMLDRIEFGVYS